MSKTATLSTSKAVFVGFQTIFDDKDQKTDNVYANFIADEYVPDYDIVLPAEQIVTSKKQIKPNLRFRLQIENAKSLSLQVNTLYSVDYASEVSTFDRSDSQTIAYSRKWLRSVTAI